MTLKKLIVWMLRLVRETLYKTKLDRLMIYLLGLDDPRVSKVARGVQGLDLVRGIPATATTPTVKPGTFSYLQSLVCRADFCERPYFFEWCAQMKEIPLYSRKQWEWAFIAQALSERGYLKQGRRGLGFAVGTEPLPAVFASLGVSILASDAPPELSGAKRWLNWNQYALDSTALNLRGICDPSTADRLLKFEPVDMNRIPGHLLDFDFCWSSCALEHLGSLNAGTDFVRRSLDPLRPGGLAVHTTELNVFSNHETLESSPLTVIYRRQDLEKLMAELRSEGHECEPLDFRFGDSEQDRFIDLAPAYTQQSPYWGKTHLKLLLEGHVTTSIGLIVKKRAE